MGIFGYIVFGIAGLLILTGIVIRGLNKRLTTLLSILLIVVTIITIHQYGWFGVYVYPAVILVMILCGMTISHGELVSRKQVAKTRQAINELMQENVDQRLAPSVESLEVQKTNEVMQAINKIDNFPTAKTVIEYSPDAETQWLAVQKLPMEYQREFLQSLDHNPRQNVKILSEELLQKHQKELNPFETEPLNAAYTRMREISNEAAKEFKNAYDVLEDTVSIESIELRITQKHGVSKKTRKPDDDETRNINLAVQADPIFRQKTVSEIGVIADYAYVMMNGSFYYGKRNSNAFPQQATSFSSFLNRCEIPETCKAIVILAKN